MLDLPRIDTLRQELGETVFQEVACDFLTEVNGVIRTLDHEKSAQSLINDLHFLKGSAMTLGFTALALLCEVFERQIVDGADRINVAPILRIYELSVRQFNALLKRRNIVVPEPGLVAVR